MEVAQMEPPFTPSHPVTTVTTGKAMVTTGDPWLKKSSTHCWFTSIKPPFIVHFPIMFLWLSYIYQAKPSCAVHQMVIRCPGPFDLHCPRCFDNQRGRWTQTSRRTQREDSSGANLGANERWVFRVVRGRMKWTWENWTCNMMFIDVLPRKPNGIQ